MNQENKARLRNIRDSLLSFAEELTFMLREEESPPGALQEEEEETTLPYNWTTANQKAAVYIKDLSEMTSLKDITIYGQIKTVLDLKSYATQTGKTGIVYRLVLADDTGEVTVVSFDDMADRLKTYTIGQYLRITNAWQMKTNKHGKKELHVGNFAKIEVVE